MIARPHVNLFGQLAVLIGFAGLTYLADHLAAPADGVVPFWLPAGFAVGVLARWGTGRIIGIILAAFLMISFADHLWSASDQLIFATLPAAMVNVLLLARLQVGFRQIDWRNCLLFVIAAAVGATIFIGAIGLIGKGLHGSLPLTDMLDWLQPWLGYVFGVLTVAPVAIFANDQRLTRLWRHKLHVGFWLAAFLAFICASYLLPVETGGHLLISLPLLLIGWAAMAFGRLGTAIATCLLCILVSWATTHGAGPFAEVTIDVIDALSQMLLYMTAALALGWIITGMSEQQQKTSLDMRLRDDALAEIGDGVLITARDQRVIYVNAGFERITGYRLDEIIGRHGSLLQGPDTDPAMRDKVEACCAAGKPFSGDILNYRKDGSSFWNALTVTPIYDADGHVQRFIGVQRDVTDRVRVARELADALDVARLALATSRHAEARYSGILDTALAGIISVDADGLIITYNRQAEEIFGHTAAEMLGQPLDRLMPLGMAKVHGLLLRGFAVGTAKRQPMSDWRQVKARRKDGSEFSMMGMISKVEVDGHLTMTIVLRDMTEIVAREHRLEQLVAEKEKEASRAQAADVAKTHFLANMSHELRTPLHAIIGFSELIARQQLGPIEKAAYVGFAEDIRQSGVGLLKLINEILDFSRIEASKYDLKAEAIDPALALNDAMSRSRGAAAQAGVTLRLAPIAGDCRLLADEKALQHILANLLSNAIKFSKKGGEVVLHAALIDNPDLAGIGPDDGAGVVDGKRIEITVRDHGAGIPADRLADVVRPFEQVANAYGRNVGGVGMGLAICASLAKAMGGALTIESELGFGTTVRLILPVAEAVDTSVAASAQVNAVSSQ
jgi:PAS domain S-box-containing protein